MRSGLITYEGLPVSSGGAHVLRARPILEHWAVVEHFLRSCTDCRAPSHLELVLHEGERVPRGFVEASRTALERWLGAPKRAHTISGAVNEDTLWWYPEPAALNEAIAWLAERQPFPEHWLGAPLELVVRVRFQFLASTGSVLPFQGPEHYLRQSYTEFSSLGESLAYIKLSTKSTFFVALSFPFESPDESFVQYVRFIQAQLPFRLSKRHWTHFRLNRAGTKYTRQRPAPVIENA